MMSTNQTFPAEKQLSANNFSNWEEHMQMHLTQYTTIGISIIRQIPFKLHEPTLDDLIGNTSIKKYSFKNADLTPASRRDFRSDLAEYERRRLSLQEESGKTCTFLKLSLSDEAILKLKNLKSYTEACNENDAYRLYTILKTTYQSSSNFCQMSHQVKQYVSLEQTIHDTLDQHNSTVLRNIKLLTNNFQDKVHTGYISINDLSVILYIRSLRRDQYQYAIDAFYASVQPNNLPLLDEVMQIFVDFSNQQDVLPITLKDDHSTALNMAHTTPLPSKSFCEVCNILITEVNPRTLKPNKFCKKCWSIKKAKPISTAVTPVSVPIITIQQAQEVLAKAKENLRAQSALLNSHIGPPIYEDFSLDELNPYAHLSLSHITNTTTLPRDPIFYYDSCCSYTSTYTLSNLENPRELVTPLSMDSSSLGHPVTASHIGTLKNFPIQLDAYYCPNAAHNLISLGALTRKGCTYRTVQPSQQMELYDPQHRIIDTTQLNSNNTWFCNILSKSSPLQSCAQTSPLIYTSEMIRRAKLCRNLHCVIGHPCNAVLKMMLHFGIFATYTILTPADVDLMDGYYHECLQCIEGKLKKLPVPLQSISFPETSIGETVFFDFQLLTVPSKHGRNTQAILYCDSKINYITTLGSPTKSNSDILTKCFQLVSHYASQGHTIKKFSTDCENICTSLRQALGEKGIDITVTTPEEHSHKVERMKQELDTKITATLCSLSYVFPPSLLLYLIKYISQCMNLSSRITSPNSACAYIEFYGVKPILNISVPFLPFGATVMFNNTLAQRQTLARISNLHINNVPKCQLGINIGTDHLYPNCYLFYTPKCNVPLPRDNFVPVNCIPFDFPSQQPLTQVITVSTVPFVPSIIPTLPVPTPHVIPRPTRTHVAPSRFSLSNLATTADSICLTPKMAMQCSLAQARIKFASFSSEIQPAVDKETTKLFITYPALQIVTYKDIPLIHNFYHLFGFMREKLFTDTGIHKSLNYRIVAAAQPQNFLSSENYGSAPTGDYKLFLLTINVVLADALHRKILHKFFLRQYDVPAAFLQVADTSTVPCYGKTPKDIGAPYANQYVKFNRCIYGTPQANAKFFADHDYTLKQLGYTTCELDVCKYRHIDNITNLLVIINTHVDDGGVVGTDRAYYELTLNALRKRYGDIVESIMTGYLGVNMNLDSTTGKLKCDVAVYIEHFLSLCNVQDLPDKHTPYPMSLFDPSTDETPIDLKSYQTVIGYVIFTLKIRTDIPLATTQAASHNANPTKSDLAKLLHLLGYLKTTSSLGPIFYAPEGPEYLAGCDVAFAVHPTGGSQISISEQIGINSAAFNVETIEQKTCVSLNPTHSEFYGISLCVELIENRRAYLSWLGFPQTKPTILRTDSSSSIFMAEADLFPKKSKNILVKHRNVRLAIANGIIQLAYEPSATNQNDLNAKPNYGPSFITKRAKLMNLDPSF